MSNKSTDRSSLKDEELEPLAQIEESGIGGPDAPKFAAESIKWLKPLRVPAFWVFVIGLGLSVFVHYQINPTWVEQKTVYQALENEDGSLYYLRGGKQKPIDSVVPYDDSPLNQSALDALEGSPSLEKQWVVESITKDGQPFEQVSLLQAKFHFGFWSLLPAILAIALCLLTREPMSALFTGILSAAFILGRFDITDAVLIPSMASKGAAGIILLYLWLLGGLMGIWTKTGAAQAFAEFMTKHFVRGPRSAKLVAWSLGVLFFQGGTVSTVLVGTTVKSVADNQNVSHEELSYIVDSTASPIASVLAFNAWPAYIQTLLFIPGVAFLSTEADRLSFFFSSVPFSFYCILAVLGTLLLSLNITTFSGAGIRRARERAASTGQLDEPGSNPLVASELQQAKVPDGYNTSVYEFFVPLILLIGTAIGTYIYSGSPQVNWAFGLALTVALAMALFKGMSLGNVVEGLGDGLKGVVVASIIIILAITVGSLSKETGGALYLVDLLGARIPYWFLPVCLQIMTMVIAFSTGSSWGTYAVAFPLAMPLAWAVAQAHGIAQPELYMSICFATILNGSVYGDQCSPISDTTILSATATGADLMDHVKTQLVPASFAATAAGILWTVAAILVA